MRLICVVLLLLTFLLTACLSSFARAQVSPEEHAKHHPGKSQRTEAGAEQGSDTRESGGMEGMMGEMMEKMGAPKPKEMYPKLMDLPNLSTEERTKIQQEAHQRMMDGAQLLSEGIDELSRAASGDDFAAMQMATAKMREGLARFESGLAARRAIAEGGAPRNVALQWFKRDMNLLPPANDGGGFRLWGMTPFHVIVMASLVLFAAAMIGMYFFKMQRTANLLQNLTGSATGGAPATIVPTAVSLGAAPASALADSSTMLVSSATKPWSGKLRVSQIFQETHNVKTFRLMNPLGGSIPFQHLPGQFLTVTVAFGGKPVKRSYTMACSPTQHDCIEFTVKREESGLVSDYLHDAVKTGDLLEITAPSGSFIFTGREAQSVVLIGGGVGITPLMSVIRYLTDRSWPGDIFFVYSCHSPKDFIFREELEYRQRRHPNLHLAVTMSGTEGADWKGATGRITKEFIIQTVPDIASRRVHICGPVPMMEALKKMLAEVGVPNEQVKTEAFGPVLGKPVSEPKAATAIEAQVRDDGKTLALPTVTFARSEKAGYLPPDKVILDVADEVGVEIDNSCRVGTCGTCRVKLLSGSVTMAVEDGLEPGDKEQRIILACQATSTGNVTVEA